MDDSEMSDLEQIISCYGKMVHQIARRRCSSREDADDVFQEVFLRLLKYRHCLNDEQHIKAWLIRVTINCSKKIFNEAWHRKRVPFAEKMNHCWVDPFETSDLYEAVDVLSETYREVVCLFYYEGLSVREIGETLAINEKTVRVRLHRARKLLREIMAD